MKRFLPAPFPSLSLLFLVLATACAGPGDTTPRPDTASAEETSEPAPPPVKPPSLEACREALDAGDYGRAIELLTRRVNIESDGDSLFLLGRAYFVMAEDQAANPDMGGDPGSAFADSAVFFDRALEAAPNHPRAGLMAAKARYMLGAADAGLTRIRTYLAAHPDDAEGLELAGRIGLVRAGQVQAEEASPLLEASIADLTRALELESTRDAAWLALGDARLQQGDIPAGLDTYKRGIATCPGANPLHERLIYLNNAEGGITAREAIAFYDECLTKPDVDGNTIDDRGRATLYWYRGTWYGMKGGEHWGREEYDLAGKAYGNHIECLVESAKRFPDFAAEADQRRATAMINRGWCGIKLERFDEAERDLFEAIRLQSILGLDPGEEPATVLAVDTLGFEISENVGKKEALGFFRRLTACWAKRHQWWNDYGYFSLETNMESDRGNEKYLETLGIYERALEAKPDYPRYLNDKAMVINYYLDPEGKRKAETEAMFKKAARLGKEAYENPFTDEREKATMLSAFTDAYVNLGRMYYLEGRHDESREVLEACLAADPRRPEAFILVKALDGKIEEGSREAEFLDSVLNKK